MSGAALPPNLFALLKGGAGLPKSKSSQDLISAIKNDAEGANGGGGTSNSPTRPSAHAAGPGAGDGGGNGGGAGGPSSSNGGNGFPGGGGLGAPGMGRSGGGGDGGRSLDLGSLPGFAPPTQQNLGARGGGQRAPCRPLSRSTRARSPSLGAPTRDAMINLWTD